ncbi:MAG: STAS domain-containing protein [Desulfobacterales bacterium]|nr:MAG: STAS domain-containing protein [Desulfobacterales bacterium]
MAAKNFKVTRNKEGTYELQGEISIHDIDAFKGFLEGSVKTGEEQEIAISLSEVGFIDTAALQLLISFKRWLEPEVKLRISALSAEAEEILSLCGLKAALL